MDDLYAAQKMLKQRENMKRTRYIVERSAEIDGAIISTPSDLVTPSFGLRFFRQFALHQMLRAGRLMSR